MPFGEELLAGVLGADLVGFHAPSCVRHFVSTETRVLGATGALAGLPWRDRTVRLGGLPHGDRRGRLR